MTSPAAEDRASDSSTSASPPSWSWTSPAIWWLLVALFFLPMVVTATLSARVFNGPPIDGPFQLYNALRRIGAGYRPGVDFQFFHGLGVPYAHYWLFRLLGGRFQDSELARQFLTIVLFPTSLVVLFRGLRWDWTRVGALTAFVLATTFALRLAPLLFAANSLVGLRSTLPILVPVVLWRARRRRTRVIALGVLLGFALFVSTEQGLAALAAAILLAGLACVRRPDWRARASDIALTAVAATVVLLVLLTAVGGFSGAMGALRYNFRLVPQNQYWFFGAPPNPFIANWGVAAGLPFEAPIIAAPILLSLAGVVFYGRRVVRGDDDRLLAALTFLSVYGLISCTSLLGVLAPVYVDACWRAVILVAALELGTRAAAWRGATLLRLPQWAAVTLVVICGVALLRNRAIAGDWAFAVDGDLLSSETQRFSANGVWPATLRDDSAIVASFTATNGRAPRVWSTYSGWLEARLGTFNPSPFDYVIHALGPDNARAYSETFRTQRPDLVQTVSPSYTDYENWIENTNWGFYHELLRNYVVAAETPWSFFWQRRADSLPAPGAEASVERIGRDGSVFRLPPTPATGHWPATLIEVEVDYAPRNPWHWLPIVGPMPRYLMLVDSAVTRMPVTLDPFVTSMRFAIVARPGDRPTLQARTFSLLPGAAIAVSQVRAWAVPLDERDGPWMEALVEGHQDNHPMR